MLGDRIGIMVEGQLKAEGTSNALKAQFGAGYRVVAERKEPRRAAGGGGSLEPNAQPLMESAGHASAERQPLAQACAPTRRPGLPPRPRERNTRGMRVRGGGERGAHCC